MEPLARLLRRARALLRSRAAEREMDDEMRYHLEMEAAERARSGADPEAARRAATLAFGGVERYKEEARDARGVRGLQDLSQDLRYAARLLRGTPGFTAVAVITIALGIGATTAIFSAVEGVLLRPFPFPESDRLVVPGALQRETGNTWNVAWAELGDWEQAGTFERAAMFRTASVNLVGDGEPERPVAAFVTDGFFATLRVAPALGRQFRPEDFDPATPAVAAISHGLWIRRYGGARDVLGRTIRMSGTPTEIIGVLPRDMQYPQQVDVFLPLRLTPQIRENFARRDNYLFQGIARLAPGKSLEATRHELDELARRVEAEVPAAREGVTMIATPFTRSVAARPTSARCGSCSAPSAASC